MIAIIRFTRAGILLRAATDDRGMVALLGIPQARIFTGVFAAGSFLAGLAGGLTAPFGNVNYTMDTTVIVTAFIVVVIGGMGNLYGALAASLAVGVVKGLAVRGGARGRRGRRFGAGRRIAHPLGHAGGRARRAGGARRRGRGAGLGRVRGRRAVAAAAHERGQERQGGAPGSRCGAAARGGEASRSRLERPATSARLMHCA